MYYVSVCMCKLIKYSYILYTYMYTINSHAQDNYSERICTCILLVASVKCNVHVHAHVPTCIVPPK